MADLHELKQAIDRLNGVSRMVAVARDGTNLLRDRQKKHEELGSYVAYVVLTAEQLKRNLSFNGPCHMIMEQASGAKILVLPSDQWILGLDLDPGTSPSDVLDQVTPIFDNINI